MKGLLQQIDRHQGISLIFQKTEDKERFYELLETKKRSHAKGSRIRNSVIFINNYIGNLKVIKQCLQNSEGKLFAN